MFLRLVSALVIAIVYAAFVGVCAFVWWRLTNDPAHPGPMILDNNAGGRILVFFSTLLAGILGAVVAVTVCLTQARKAPAVIFGAAVGIVVFLLLFENELKSVLSEGPPNRIELYQTLVKWFIWIPVGLTLTGLAASLVTSRLRR
jgi:hypothetical protein